MLLKEYRICMPLSVEEYKIGQLFMIAKHSDEQSKRGEGVEVVTNEPCEDPKHGKGQLTEKRIYLSSRLPGWLASYVSNMFYITEKAWNYYPYTITEYTCSFIPKFSIHIETKYEGNCGTTENCMGLEGDELSQREVDEVDIANDEFPEHCYKEEEDPSKFVSKKTNRGPLTGKTWKEDVSPIMCSYKVVRVKFEVWGLQTRVEAYTQKVVRDILLVGHRQAFTWIDEWIGMSMEDIRQYEKNMQAETNKKVAAAELGLTDSSSPTTPNNTPTESTADIEQQLTDTKLSPDS